jgi:hypothetical protein
MVVPDSDELDRVVERVANAGQEPESREDGVLVRDPSQNALLLTSEPDPSGTTPSAIPVRSQ